MHEELADVGSVEQQVDRGRKLFEAFDHGLQRLRLAGADPTSELLNRLRLAVKMVEHDEALQVHALDQQRSEVARAGGRLGVVVGGDQAAEHHPRVQVQPREDRIHDLPADVFEIHADAAGSCLGQPFSPVRGPTIDRGVEASPGR
jgi:hypothetical protein